MFLSTRLLATVLLGGDFLDHSSPQLWESCLLFKVQGKYCLLVQTLPPHLPILGGDHPFWISVVS